jgi:predicted AAA+ superfamily ATPase
MTEIFNVTQNSFVYIENFLHFGKKKLFMKIISRKKYIDKVKLKRSGFNVYVGQLNGKEIDFVVRRGDEIICVQVSMNVTAPETYEREFGNLKQIKDNYPKYVITMDPNAGLVHDSEIIVNHAREFLLRNI